jgi:hypothetical protein
MEMRRGELAAAIRHRLDRARAHLADNLPNLTELECRRIVMLCRAMMSAPSDAPVDDWETNPADDPDLETMGRGVGSLAHDYSE